MGFFLSVAFFGSSLLPYFSGLWGVGEEATAWQDGLTENIVR